MAPKLQITRILGAVALAAAFLLAPSAASAHAGHSHAKASVDRTAVTKVVKAEVSAAKVLPSVPHGDDECDGFGCCSSGPCTGCHGGVLTSTQVPMPPLLSVSLARGETLSRASPHDGRLRRPPKSFV